MGEALLPVWPVNRHRHACKFLLAKMRCQLLGQVGPFNGNLAQ